MKYILPNTMSEAYTQNWLYQPGAVMAITNRKTNHRTLTKENTQCEIKPGKNGYPINFTKPKEVEKNNWKKNHVARLFTPRQIYVWTSCSWNPH